MVEDAASRIKEILPLRRISPSRYWTLKQCSLRGVLEANRHPHYLPTPPASHIGKVIHTILEEAATGKFADRDSIVREWEFQISKVESALRNSWLHRHLIPLSNHVKDYEVRKLRAIKAAHKISAAYKHGTSHPNLPTATNRTVEVWLDSNDGIVGGYVDRVVTTSAGTIIQDYKSGEIYESIDDIKAIRTHYVIQIQLYAALFASKHKIWPIRLQLIDLNGEKIDIPFDPESCIKLLDDAIKTHHQTNEAITRTYASHIDQQYALANPGSEQCRFCQFRPVCTPYQENRAPRAPNNEWPKDIWGKITNIAELRNSKLIVTVTSNNPSSSTYQIKGIDRSHERHPALKDATVGDQLAFFNLRVTSAPVMFNEGPYTVIYRPNEIFYI